MRGRQLSDYGIPQPLAVDNDRLAREYCKESYDQGEQQAYVEHNAALLAADQCNVYGCFCSMIKLEVVPYTARPKFLLI